MPVSPGMCAFWRTDIPFPFQVRLTVTGLPVESCWSCPLQPLRLFSERGRKSAFGISFEDIFPPRFFLLKLEVLFIQFASFPQAGRSLPIWLDVLPVGSPLIQFTEREQQSANQSQTPGGSLQTEAMRDPVLCYLIERDFLLGLAFLLTEGRKY